jgi:hypothetical protein
MAEGLLKAMPTKVLIPIYRVPLTADEAVSLDSIRTHFPAEKLCFVAPHSLPLDLILRAGESSECFEDEFFKGIEGYNQLLTNSAFYERFTPWPYILICQLDCLVFRDELEEWSCKGYDYIAAPWFRRFVNKPYAGLWRVGNGGFSLRNVQSHLRVLAKRIVQGTIYPEHGGSPWLPTEPSEELGLYQKIVPWYRRKNPFAVWTTIEEELRRYPRNEDLFWSLEAPKFDPLFKIASAQEALPFAFEMAPDWCFGKNGGKLPFGCHAWAKYDRSFWEEVMKGNRGT